MLSSTLPIHPRTGLRALGVMPSGRICWPILGAAEGGDGGDGGAGGTGGDGGGAGAPAYTPPATQADFDRIIQDRVRRATARFSDYDTLKEQAARGAALELELGTAADKAAAKAREEAAAETAGKFAPRIVRAEFRAEAKGVLTDEQLDALLEDIDLSKFVDKDGEVDQEKIAKKIKAFAPAGNGGGGGNGTTGRPHVSLGQGTQPPSTAKKGDAGRAEAQRRFGSKAAAS